MEAELVMIPVLEYIGNEIIDVGMEVQDSKQLKTMNGAIYGI